MLLTTLAVYAGLLSVVAAIDCAPTAFTSLVPSNASVKLVIKVAAGSTFTLLGDSNSPRAAVVPNLPALCAASISVNPGSNASYDFGLFLPENWNGRFLTVGNGGFAGGIQWGSMGNGVRYGFAVASTDTGHSESASGATWAWQNPDAITNWAHAAMHGTVVNAKQIVKSFYGKDIAYSYYRGCSTGGRQGFKEAQLYPEDFDGIVAGAPAWWTAHLQMHNFYMGYRNLPVGAPHRISSQQVAALGAEVLKQCDPQDGVRDNIISNPRACIFRPETLLCNENEANSTSCFTQAQMETVTTIYSDWFEANQTFVFPHLELGSESEWNMLVTVNEPTSLGTDYIRYMLGLGPNWNWRDWNPSIISLSDRMNPGNATFNDFDLSPFHKRGGKILHYHGWSDGGIATGSSVYLYNQILRTMQPKRIKLDDFYRFFLVPGLKHCAGTDPKVNAPWYFAGDNQHNALGAAVHSVPGFSDPQHDVLLAMMAWVENGTAPDHIVGTKYANDTAHDKVSRQRPLCMYPKEAKYLGTGDVDQAVNWKCQSLY